MGNPDLYGAEFRKSSYSGTGNDCVEVAGNLAGVVAVRDSKVSAGAVLVFSSDDWRGFLSMLR